MSWSSGLAWASHKSLFREVGFYDYYITGSGDLAMFLAACNEAQNFSRIFRGDSYRQEKCYLNWAKKFSQLVDNSIYYVNGNILHLWHGDFQNRQYSERYKILNKLDFDPHTDIAIDANGCWCWNSDKPELHQYLKEYFLGRKEDG